VQIAAVGGVGAEGLERVPRGVSVRWEHLLGRRQRVEGGQSRWRRRSKSASALTTLAMAVVVVAGDVRVLNVSFLFARGRQSMTRCSLPTYVTTLHVTFQYYQLQLSRPLFL